MSLNFRVIFDSVIGNSNQIMFVTKLNFKSKIIIVKPEYNDLPRDPKIVSVVDR